MTIHDDPKPLGAVLGKTVEQIVAEAREAPAVFARPADDYADAATEREAAVVDHRVELWHARIPRRFADASLGDFADGIEPGSAVDLMLTDLDAWCDRGGRENVVILGPVGVGKTHLAVAAARLRHHRGDLVQFCPVVELLDAMRPGGDPAALDVAARASLLILDDLGAERPTDWTAERLYALINRRWLDERPIIVTSNLTPDELREAIGERMYSRLAHGAIACYVVGDGDRRRP